MFVPVGRLSVYPFFLYFFHIFFKNDTKIYITNSRNKSIHILVRNLSVRRRSLLIFIVYFVPSPRVRFEKLSLAQGFPEKK